MTNRRLNSIIKIQIKRTIKLIGDRAMKRIYGYARISTRKQSIERQIRNIKEKYANAIIVEEAYTGTKVEGRKAFIKLIQAAKRDAENGIEVMIVFDSVSRMSRNAEIGYELYKELYECGIELVFIKEPQINTQTYREAMERKIQNNANSGDEATDELINTINAAINNYTMRLVEKQIKLAFDRSEAEVIDLKQRTKEGLKTVVINGGTLGRKEGQKITTKKSVEAKAKIIKYSKDFNGALNDKDAIKIIGIAPNTYYKYKREIKEENAVS